MEEQANTNAAQEMNAQVETVTVQTAVTKPSDFIHGFARVATVRAVRTMAQTAASLMGAKALISDVDWKALLSAVLMSGMLSILTSVYTGLPETELTATTADSHGGNAT